MHAKRDAQLSAFRWQNSRVLNVNVAASQKHVMLVFGHERCSALGQFPKGL